MTTDDATPAAVELLAALPYGVLALRSDGAIVYANARAYELVPGLATSAARTCRDLYLCQAPGGPCERGCLVARAAAGSEPAPEIRIDTSAEVAPGALWVTASPLPGGNGVVLHLRPGWRGDRRRRSQDRWQTGPELRIHALGRTHVEAVDLSSDNEWLSQRPGQILKYLVCERRRIVMVDEIAESIWPESGRRAVGNARYSMHRLRMKLEPNRAAHEAPAFVVSQGSGYALHRERVWIDVDEFERALEEGKVAMARLDHAAAAQHLERAVALYRGAFLADEPYADWAGDERNRLAGLAAGALRVLIALARDRGDTPNARHHLLRLADLEPLDIGVHRELIQALLAEGRRSDAKRRYASFAERLRREFGEEPGFDLQSLSRPRAS